MTNHPPEELDVEVFRAGDYGERGRYGPETLEAIARDYDPESHEAPVTFDHDQQGPAHGWVRRVRLLGDRLVATLAGLSPALAEALRRRRFPKRSVELYRRFAATGRPYLKAVSFLGAAAPAVKGLRDPLFTAGGEEATAAFVEEVEAQPSSTRQESSEQQGPCSAALEAKARLLSMGRWHPRWEGHGMLDVFGALADRRELDTLVAVLAGMPPPVPMEPLETVPEAPAEAFSEELVGGASPDSVTRHRQAMEQMRRTPGLSYSEALVR